MLSRLAAGRMAACAPTRRFAPVFAAPAAAVAARHLNLHECDSKKLLSKFGCKTEFGIACETMEEVEAACDAITSEKKVVKSQILAGGRGKGTFVDGFQGGVHVCSGKDAAVATARKMLGNTLVTKQTGPAGLKVSKLFVTEAVPNIQRELYLALLLDRKTCSPTFIGCAEGGMNIEELAHKFPEKIKKMPIDVFVGPVFSQCVDYAKQLGFTDATAVKAAQQIIAIYNLARAKDATMIEINPLVELENGEVWCIDAKLSFDDNAGFRQEDVWAMEDKSQIDPKEALAAKYDLNYIALDGNVGCLVNGAGLAMSTMDIISLYGQKPANFLDVGGSARTDQIVNAFQIITGDPNVTCILVNIFGGIMKCDTIANGVVEACKVLGGLRVPLVVRLSGTNEELGRKILKDSNLPITAVADLDEAGRVAAELAAKSQKAKK